MNYSIFRQAMRLLYMQYSGVFDSVRVVWASVGLAHVHITQAVYFFNRIDKSRVELLCVSYPSAIEFSAILFLLFARSSSNSPRSFQRFRQTLRRNFNWIRQ